MVKFEDMLELRKRVVELVNEDKVLIKWYHIRSCHDVQGHEVLNALRYGTLPKPDVKEGGRYVTWSRLTENRVLIRVVFEVQKINGERLVVVTAFEE